MPPNFIIPGKSISQIYPCLEIQLTSDIFPCMLRPPQLDLPSLAGDWFQLLENNDNKTMINVNCREPIISNWPMRFAYQLHTFSVISAGEGGRKRHSYGLHCITYFSLHNVIKYKFEISLLTYGIILLPVTGP